MSPLLPFLLIVALESTWREKCYLYRLQTKQIIQVSIADINNLQLLGLATPYIDSVPARVAITVTPTQPAAPNSLIKG